MILEENVVKASKGFSEVDCVWTMFQMYNSMRETFMLACDNDLIDAMID